jgi:hypothetical protein
MTPIFLRFARFPVPPGDECRGKRQVRRWRTKAVSAAEPIAAPPRRASRSRGAHCSSPGALCVLGGSNAFLLATESSEGNGWESRGASHDGEPDRATYGSQRLSSGENGYGIREGWRL